MKSIPDRLAVTLPLAVLHAFVLFVVEGKALTKYAMYGDGAEYFWQAKGILQGVLTSVHPLLYPLLMRGLAFLTQFDLAALLIPVTFHILSVIPVYEIVRHTKTAHPEIWSVILTTFPPSLTLYSSLALSDSIAFFFSTLFFYFLVKRKELGLLLSGMLVGTASFIGNLLVLPAAYFYFKSSWKNVYRAIAVVLPLAGLAYYQGRGKLPQGLLYYINYHEYFSTTFWNVNLFSWPCESLVKSILGLPTPYPASRISEIYVVGLLGVYFVSWILCWIHGNRESFWFATPFLLFLTFYQGWFFIPRYIAFCFPVLLTYQSLLKRKSVVALGALIALGGSLYAIYYLWTLPV